MASKPISQEIRLELVSELLHSGLGDAAVSELAQAFHVVELSALL
jgi:hypothetical protein